MCYKNRTYLFATNTEKVRPGLFQGVASIRRTKSVVFACSFSARAELRSRQGIHALQVGRCILQGFNGFPAKTLQFPRW